MAPLALEDVVRIKEQIARSLRDANEKLVLDLLENLRSFKASTESLKSTKIGIFVTDIRKHSNATDAIREASKSLVHKWKLDIGRVQSAHPSHDAPRTPSAAHTAGSNASSASKSHKNDTPSAPTFQRRDSEMSTHSSGPATPSNSGSTANAPAVLERTVSQDGISMRSTGDKTRDKCCEMLYAALATGTDAPGKVISKISEVVEGTVYAEHRSTDVKYKSRIRSLVSNLRDKSNPTLRESVVSGSISPKRFALMTPEEMMSKDRKAEAERALKESMNDAVSAVDNQAETDMFKCGKCGQRKTKYFQMQTRSADEPMTTFVTCVNCGNKWKFC